MNCYLITTYNRSKECRELVSKLRGDVYIVDDGSTEDYSWVTKYKNCIYYKQYHRGKEGYYETVNTLFYMIPKDYSYYFMIPDDFTPVNGFRKRAVDTWNKLPKDAICLTMYVDLGRFNKACWTGFLPEEHDEYRKTQWVDMCFMCDSLFFKEVGVIPIPTINWKKRPNYSSGVGLWISNHLHENEWGMYQTKTSLFIPQDIPSRMNEWRKGTDLINKPVL